MTLQARLDPAGDWGSLQKILTQNGSMHGRSTAHWRSPFAWGAYEGKQLTTVECSASFCL